VYFDRQADTKGPVLRQMVNLCLPLGAPNALAAKALLDRNLKNNGVCSISVDLNLDPDQCRDLFIRKDGAPYEQAEYISRACESLRDILAGQTDPLPLDRLKLFNQPPANIANGLWHDLQEAGTRQNIEPILTGRVHMSATNAQFAVTDVLALLGWSSAMAAFAQALNNGDPLDRVGGDFVKADDMGFNEPWFLLTAWRLAGTPDARPLFTSTLLPPAAPAVSPAVAAAAQ
jgi:hypothetical protein